MTLGQGSAFDRRSLLRLGVGGAAAAGLSGLVGCSPQGSSSQGNAAAPAGSVLRVAQSKDTKGLDPQLESGLEAQNILINMFDTLTWRSTDNKLVPRLATSWEAVDDLHWRFHLRQGVKFHNGEPFNAEAAKFSLERLINPATKSTIVELRAVKNVQVLDEHTIDVVMKTPDPVIPEKVSLFGGMMIPPKYLAEVGPKVFQNQPVGTGPYIFTDWRKDFRLRMHANDQHWNGRPHFDELQFLPMPNQASALASLQSDGVDLISGVEPEAALQLRGFKGVEVQSFPGIRMYFIVLDNTHPILSDVRVRRALNHAVDVPLLIRSILNGSGREAPTIVPREAFGFDPEVTPFPRDVGLARQLLAEAGHPDGVDLTMTASNKDALLCQALAGMLGEAGIRVKLDLLEQGTYSTRLGSDDQNSLGSMYLTGSTGWTLDGEATMQSYIRSDRKRSRVRSPEADQMIDILEQKVDPQVRLQTFARMQRWLRDQAPFLFLYQANLNFATNGRAQWTPNVIGSLLMETAR